jgi:hypothetical protein
VELDDLYSSANVALVIKSRRIRFAVNMPRVGREERFIQSFYGASCGKETTLKM